MATEVRGLHGGRSFGDELDARDAARFVGRDSELTDLSDLLAPRPAWSVTYLHGPAGIGKSAVARDLARRAVRSGLAATWVDVELAAPNTFPTLGVGVSQERPALVVVDGFLDGGGGEGDALRRRLAEALRGEDRVLVVSRRPPDAGWFRDAWGTATRALTLRPLAHEHAADVLDQLGVSTARHEAVLAWAQGRPGALAVAARHDRAGRHLLDLEDDPELARDLLDVLMGAETGRVAWDVLRVAALVPQVDRRLLSAVLDEEVPEAGTAALAGLSVALESAQGVALDGSVRWAVATVAAAQDPLRDKDTRRAVADHLHERVTAGESRWLPALAELFRDRRRRWAFGVDARRRHRVDRPREGDADRAAEALGAAGTEWWEGVRRWFEEAPEAVTVARDERGGLSGFCIMTTPAGAPPWVEEDVVMGPRVRHAAERYPAGDVVLWRDAFGFPADEGEDPAGPFVVAHHGAVLRSGRVDASCTYGSVVPGDPTRAGLATAYGAVPVEELHVRDGERTVECWVLHSGFGGFSGAARALLYQELGLEPPRPDLTEVRRAVREALRTFHDPLALASNPLAAGSTLAERAASVRQLLEVALTQAFGASGGQRLEREALRRGYFEGAHTHDEATRAMHVSRSTYFRHLSSGVERLAVYVHGTAAPGDLRPSAAPAQTGRSWD